MRIVLSLLAVLLSFPVFGTTFYVATNGSDLAAGTIGEPFLTFSKAHLAVKALSRPLTEPVTVYIRGGRYMMQSRVKLTLATDSGSVACPITYRAYPGEVPILCGGVTVSDFAAVTDEAVLARLTPSAQANVVQSTLTEQVITNLIPMARCGGGLYFSWDGQNELYFGDKPMTLAQFPNTGWLTIATNPAAGADHFSFISATPTGWDADTNLWIQGYLGNEWGDIRQHIASLSVTNGTTNTIYLTAPQGAYGYEAGGRFRVLNVLEELDSAGEYYIDRINGILYFWPPSNIAAGNPFVGTAGKAGEVNNGGLVTFENVTNVILSDLTFSGAVGSLVMHTWCSANVISNCTFLGSAGDAVAVMGSYNTTITRCSITNSGERGIYIYDDAATANRSALTSSSNSITYNQISDCGRMAWSYNPAIELTGVGCSVSHNVLHNGKHLAIRLMGNNHLIEYNDMHNFCTETSEIGAIYMDRNWSERGNVIRYNSFRDINLGGGAVNATEAPTGVYLDDLASGTTIYGNVFCSVDSAILVGGGRDNTIQNNIFVNCTNYAIRIDQRGLTWYASEVADEGSVLWTTLNAMPYTTPPWSVQYPPLVLLPTNSPGAALGNVVNNNVSFENAVWRNMVNGDPADFVSLNNLTNADPLFVTYSTVCTDCNFRFQVGSPVYAAIPGWTEIQFDQIGFGVPSVIRVPRVHIRQFRIR